MECILSESGLNIALQYRLLLATRYLILHDALVRVYSKHSSRWEGPFKVLRVSKKTKSGNHGEKFQPFNISAVLPIPPRSNDRDLKSDMESIKTLFKQNDHVKFTAKIIKPAEARTKSYECRDSTGKKSVACWQEVHSNMSIKGF